MIKKQFFPDTTIRNVASNDAVYMRGKALYKDHRITNLSGDPGKNTVTVHVQENGDNEVSWGFFPNGLAKRYHCSCSEFQRYSGGCQHVTASMFALNDLEASEIPTEGKAPGNSVTIASRMELLNQQAIEELFGPEESEAESVRRSLRQTDITVEFTLMLGKPEFFQPFSMTMRVGEEYLYVVQDVRQVVEDLLEGQLIPFGKRFTYDPEFYSLKEADETMLRLLQEIDHVFESVEAVQQFASPKEFIIPPQFIQRILRQLEKCSEGYVQKSYKKSYDTGNGKGHRPIVYTAPSKVPVTLSIEKQESNQLKLFIAQEDFKDLNFYKEGRFAEKEEQFYFLSNAMLDRIKRLKQAFSLTDYQGIGMGGEQASDFISRFLPQIEKAITVDMSEDVQHEFVRKDLKAHLKIDSDGEELSVAPEFHYGEFVVEPLEDSSDASSEREQEEGIVIRDIEKEKALLKQLRRASSEWEDEGKEWILRGEDAVGDFLYGAVPELMDDFQIYLTPTADRLFEDTSSSPSLEMEWNQSANMLDVSFQTENMSTEDLQRMMKQLNNKKRFVKLTNGKLLNLNHEGYRQLADSAEALDLSWQDIKQHMTVPVYKGLSVADKEDIKKGKQFQTLVSQLFDPATIPFSVPKTLHATLRPYQETGIKWLKTLDHYGFGGVLADDMGLGKTLQTIGYIAACLEEQDDRFMIICPSSVLFNWQKEFETFAPSIPTILIQGNAQEREELIKQAKEEEVSVWITSYPLVMRDTAFYEGSRFRTVILDEAQYVKNHTAKTTLAVRQLLSRTKIALSGTPIENNLGELFTMFSIVMPGLFSGRKQFKQMETKEIARKVRPFILRRLKKEVLADLPEKVETNEYIDLSHDQKKLYQTQVQMIRTDIENLADKRQFDENRFRILAGMTRLRQICCDPRLILPDYTGGSSKLERLLEFVSDALASGRRIVIFSQFTKMLALIRQALDQEEESYFYLDGSTKSADRLNLTTRFNEGEKNLFLISLKAGGTGLNLTGGDTVILYDSWWNPAIEEQAADRVHRFGQKKNVQVIRMIAQGTIEERINELQQKKKELIDSVIETGEQDLTSLTKDEILSLLD